MRQGVKERLRAHLEPRTDVPCGCIAWAAPFRSEPGASADRFEVSISCGAFSPNLTTAGRHPCEGFATEYVNLHKPPEPVQEIRCKPALGRRLPHQRPRTHASLRP